MLSNDDKTDILKQVPFFQGTTAGQLAILADACEVQHFPPDATIISQGAHNETLYIIVHGRVAIQQRIANRNAAHVMTLEPHHHFGETSLFHYQAHATEVVALIDTTTLKLSREVLERLARQEPDLALQVIRVLEHELSEAQTRIAELSRTRSPRLQRLFDQLEEK